MSTISDKTCVYCQLELTKPHPGQAHVRSQVGCPLQNSVCYTRSIDGHHQIFAGVEHAEQIAGSPTILRSGACDCSIYNEQDMVTASRDQAAQECERCMQEQASRMCKRRKRRHTAPLRLCLLYLAICETEGWQTHLPSHRKKSAIHTSDSCKPEWSEATNMIASIASPYAESHGHAQGMWTCGGAEQSRAVV